MSLLAKLGAGAWHVFNDVLGAIGMVVGAVLGTLAPILNWILKKTLHIQPFKGGIKHTVIASALGWGSMFAVGSTYSRLHFVGPVDNAASRLIGANAKAGQLIDEDVISTPPAPGATTQDAAVAADWGLVGPSDKMVMVAKFPNKKVINRLFAIPYSTGKVPAGTAGNNQLTVTKHNPGLTDSLGAP